LTGNEVKAAEYTRFAFKILNEVKRDMQFQELFQLQRREPLPGGGWVKCKVTGTIPEVEIFMPMGGYRKIKVVEEQKYRPPVYYLVNFSYMYVVGVFWESVQRCSVWDVANERVAQDVPLNDGSGYATFPCGFNEISDMVYGIPSEYVQPMNPLSYYEPTRCGNSWSEWDNDPSDWHVCRGTQPIFDVSNDVPLSRSGTCRGVHGDLQTFSDSQRAICHQTQVMDADYHGGHDKCCIVNATYCLDYEEGTFNWDRYYYKTAYGSYGHGMEGKGITTFSDDDFRMYTKLAKRSRDVAFTHGFPGGASVYCTADFVQYERDYTHDITRTWDILEDHCRNPGGMVKRDEYNVTRWVQEIHESELNNVTNMTWHHPWGSLVLPDQRTLEEYTYHRATDEFPQPANHLRTVTGQKVIDRLGLPAQPAPPGGMIWPDTYREESGNCIFQSPHGEPYLPEYACIVQNHGFPWYYTLSYTYPAELKEPKPPDWSSQWTWGDRYESAVTEYPPVYMGAIEFPVGGGQIPDEVFERYNPNGMTPDSKFSAWLTNLAWSTIKYAPWKGKEVWEGGHTIRTVPPGHLTFRQQRIIPWPWVRKDEVI